MRARKRVVCPKLSDNGSECRVPRPASGYGRLRRSIAKPPRASSPNVVGSGIV